MPGTTTILVADGAASVEPRVVRVIVEQHGGKVWFDSRPGEGSRFYFTIPKQQRGES